VWDKNEGAVKPKAEHGNDDFNEAGWVTISAFHVSGVDFNKGLERFDGDADTYMNVMRSFAQNVPIILEKVVTVPEGNLKEYTTTVHGIKGSCYGICAEETGALAEALESAAKEEDYDYLNANNHAFVESTRKLLSDIAELFAHVSPEKQAKQQPDPELLKQLLEACNRHDMNEIDSIAAELDAYTYETDGDLVTWLREMADEMNYSDMAERLAQFSQ
jgi:HPt (histidine-containing phosphotransfer) domain-containing protein